MSIPLISIIVPVYNAEGSLSRCITSLQTQTWKNLEIILIDDGSSDHSFALCKQYALEDSRIHAFHKTNGGVSSARNMGLTCAQGSLIGFCDADDWVEPDYYERLILGLLEHNAQMAFGGYDERNISDGTIFEHHPSITGLVDGWEALRQCVLPQGDGYFTSLWNKVFRKDILKEPDGSPFVFPEDIDIGEDETLLVHCCPQANCVFLCNNGGYHWSIRDDSTCHCISLNSRAITGITGKERCLLYAKEYIFPANIICLMKARIFRENIHVLVMARYNEDGAQYRALRRRILAGLPAMLVMKEHSFLFKLRLLVLTVCVELRFPLILVQKIEHYSSKSTIGKNGIKAK